MMNVGENYWLISDEIKFSVENLFKIVRYRRDLMKLHRSSLKIDVISWSSKIDMTSTGLLNFGIFIVKLYRS